MGFSIFLFYHCQILTKTLRHHPIIITVSSIPSGNYSQSMFTFPCLCHGACLKEVRLKKTGRAILFFLPFSSSEGRTVLQVFSCQSPNSWFYPLKKTKSARYFLVPYEENYCRFIYSSRVIIMILFFIVFNHFFDIECKIIFLKEFKSYLWIIQDNFIVQL
jgi:hypothetical protein